SSPPCSRIFFDRLTSTPSPDESMYPVLEKSTRNFRAPPSSSSSTFCFSSCRLPTISWPSTSMTVTSPCFFTSKLMPPPFNGRRNSRPPTRLIGHWSGGNVGAAPGLAGRGTDRSSGLQRGHAGGVHDVGRTGAPRQIAARQRQTLEQRSDGV